MNRTALVTVFAVALALVATAAAGGVAGSTSQADAESNASFGAEVSSFMQASSAEAPAEVGDGMFAVALNRTEDPEERKQLVQERVAALQERERHLEARREAMNDSDSVTRMAIATEVAIGANELEESANGTQRAAEAAGLNTTALAEIRANASEMHGRAVAEIAGTIAGPPAGDVGPPTDVPGVGPDNESAHGQDRAENASEDPGDGGSEGNDDMPDSGGDGGPNDDTGADEAPAEDDS